MFRGDVDVTSYDKTGTLDTVIEMGVYKVKPKQGVWGTLVVFNTFDGAGGVVQKLYNATGAKYRVKNSNTDNLWTDWKSFFQKIPIGSCLGGLIVTATANKDGLMPAGQVFTNPGSALNAGQVCLLSTSRYASAFNIIVWHPWRGIASYHILLSDDSSKAIYKIIALSNLSSQKFYVTISDNKTISIYLKNNSEGPMNLSIQPVTSFKTTPVITTLPEDAIEVVVE